MFYENSKIFFFKKEINIYNIATFVGNVAMKNYNKILRCKSNYKIYTIFASNISRQCAYNKFYFNCKVCHQCFCELELQIFKIYVISVRLK